MICFFHHRVSHLYMTVRPLLARVRVVSEQSVAFVIGGGGGGGAVCCWDFG
jgi:hypothetical protein